MCRSQRKSLSCLPVQPDVRWEFSPSIATEQHLTRGGYFSVVSIKILFFLILPLNEQRQIPIDSADSGNRYKLICFNSNSLSMFFYLGLVCFRNGQ